MKKHTELWLQHAGDDLHAAEELHRQGRLFRIVCFHAHQAVEKSLKALFIEHDIRLRKTHDLLFLFTLLDSTLQPELTEDHLDFLNSVYIDSRYPSAIGLLPGGEPWAEDAEKAVRYAKLITTGIIQKLHQGSG